MNFPGLRMVTSFLFKQYLTPQKRREHWVIFWDKFIGIQTKI